MRIRSGPGPASDREIPLRAILPQRHVNPQIRVARRKCIPERIASRFRIALLPELHPLFVILSGFFHFSGVNELEITLFSR